MEKDGEDSLTIILAKEFVAPGPIKGHGGKQRNKMVESADPGMDGMSIVEFDNLHSKIPPAITMVRSLFIGNPRSPMGILLASIVECHESLRSVYEKIGAIQDKNSKIRQRKVALLGSRQQAVYCGDGGRKVSEGLKGPKGPGGLKGPRGPDGPDGPGGPDGPEGQGPVIRRYWLVDRRDAICNRDQLSWDQILKAIQRLSKAERTDKFLQQAGVLMQLNDGKESLAAVISSILLSKLLVFRVEKIFLTSVAMPPGRAEIIESEEIVAELDELRAHADTYNLQAKELRAEAARLYCDAKVRHDQLTDNATKLGFGVFVTGTHRISKMPAHGFSGGGSVVFPVVAVQQTISAVLEAQYRLLYKKPMSSEKGRLSAGNFLMHVKDACWESLEKQRTSTTTGRWTVISLGDRSENNE